MLRNVPEMQGKVDETVSPQPGSCGALSETITRCAGEAAAQRREKRLGKATSLCEVPGTCVSALVNFP